MIEFKGYLTGASEKRFFTKSKIIGLKILIPSLLLLMPFAIHLLYTFQFPAIACIALVAIFPIAFLIPQPKKERLSLTPKHICINDTHIVCVADKYEEIRRIDDVKRVTDRGEYYEIDFRFGKISEKFICQKDLISKGTLREFEALFSKKLTRGRGGQGDGSVVSSDKN